MNIFTFGTNYYFHKHNAKATFDVVWVSDALPFSDSGAGLDRTDLNNQADQIALRAPFRLLF